MKLYFFLVIFALIEKFSLRRILKVKRIMKKAKVKDSIVQIKYAVGPSYENQDSSHQFFDMGSLIDNMVVTDNTKFEDIIEKLNEEITDENAFKFHDMDIRRIKIYSRPFYSVSHEYLMVCAFDKEKNKEHYFVIDRGAKEEDKTKTKVRIIYTGKIGRQHLKKKKLQICDTNSEEWAEFRGVLNGKVYSKLLGEHSVDNLRITSLKALIDSVIKYAIKYPQYGLLSTNCQHFATGFFNAVTYEEIEKKSISNPYLSFRCNTKVTHGDILDEIILSKQ